MTRRLLAMALGHNSKLLGHLSRLRQSQHVGAALSGKDRPPLIRVSISRIMLVIDEEPARRNVVEAQNPNHYVNRFNPGIGLRRCARGGNSYTGDERAHAYGNTDRNAHRDACHNAAPAHLRQGGERVPQHSSVRGVRRRAPWRAATPVHGERY